MRLERELKKKKRKEEISKHIECKGKKENYSKKNTFLN